MQREYILVTDVTSAFRLRNVRNVKLPDSKPSRNTAWGQEVVFLLIRRATKNCTDPVI
jgi:hypothetical protein